MSGIKPPQNESLSEVTTLPAEKSTLQTRGMECALYKWSPPNKEKIKGIAVVYHGFGAHSNYPTVKYASSLLAESGLFVYGLDLPGHGASPGTRGLLTGVDDLIEDGVAVAKYAKEDCGEDLPLFLVGSSMGGAIALAVANRLPEIVKGVVMLAPMLSLNVGSTARTALGALSCMPLINNMPLIPSSATTPDQQYRDAERRLECENDTMTYKGNMRPQSANTCVAFTDYIQTIFDKVTVPFLCMIAEEDVVVDNSQTKTLMEKALSTDKTLKSYAALHGLLCEPAPLLGIIESDLIEWLMKRC